VNGLCERGVEAIEQKKRGRSVCCALCDLVFAFNTFGVSIFFVFANYSVVVLATPYRDPLGVESPGAALLPVWVGPAGAL
jgi:hypothetical protein